MRKWLNKVFKLKEPRPIQEIFNIVINNKLYSPDSTSYMCVALKIAYRKKLITKKEKTLAIKEIHEYLGEDEDSPFAVLRIRLAETDKPYTFKDCLAIYKNWNNRPELTKERA